MVLGLVGGMGDSVGLGGVGAEGFVGVRCSYKHVLKDQE